MAFENMIPPHSVEAEQSVLGSVILDPTLLEKVRERLKSDDFYTQGHSHLFQTLVDMDDRNIRLDLVTITDDLRTKKRLEDIGGVSYLVELTAFVPTVDNVEYYTGIVREKAICRELLLHHQRAIHEIYRAENIEKVITAGQEEVQSIQDRSNSSTKDRFVSIKDALMESFQRLERRAFNESRMEGTPTGFTDLDTKLNGFHPEELIVIAARPGMGKTAFALNIASNIARENKPVAFFNLEMSVKSMADRLLGMESNIDSDSIRKGDVQEDQWDRAVGAFSTLGDSPLIMIDSSYTLSQIRADCRRFKREYGEIGVIIIDYLQLISVEGNYGNSNERVSHITRSLKLLTRELGCPIVVLSQLSRSVEQRQDKRPMLSDLRDSGAIEQDSDVVMFLYRDDYYDPESTKQNVAEVIIAKQRNGSTGKIELLYMRQFSRFFQLDR